MEKSTKKILNAILKFSPEPSDRELNSSAMHVENVMNTKLSPQSIVIDFDHEGKRMITVMNSTPEGWRKQMWKEARVLEACLYGETLSVGLVLSTCLRFSRKLFEQSITTVRLHIDNGDVRQSAVASPVLISSRKSQSMALPLQYKPASVTHRSVIRTSVACCDWKVKMTEMLLDLNRESLRAVAWFLTDYRARQEAPKPMPVPIVKQSKTERAKAYESCGAVSPLGEGEGGGGEWEEIPGVELHRLKDVRSAWFPRSTPLPQRIHTMHSCLIIQRAIRCWLSFRQSYSILILQSWFRMLIARKALTQLRLLPFKRLFLIERLKHWLRLLAGKWRMAKDKTQMRNLDTYLGQISTILLLQKAVRGLLARRKVVPWARLCHRMRCIHRQAHHRVSKLLVWQRSKLLEEEMLKNAFAVSEQLQYFQQTLYQGKKIKGFKTEKDIAGYVKNMEKAEARDRKQQTKLVAEIRVRTLKT